MKEGHYFIKLRSEFENNPFQERILEEMEAHAEDLIEDQAVPEKSVDDSFLRKHFGEPNDVKKTFIEITDPWQKWLQRLEALVYGTFLIMWASISDILNLLVEHSYYSTQTFIVLAFLLLPYPFIWKKLLSRKNNLNSNTELLAWVSIPNLIFLGLSWINFTRNLGVNSSIDTEFYLKMTGISIALGLITFALFQIKGGTLYQKLLLGGTLSINATFLGLSAYKMYRFWGELESVEGFYFFYTSGLIIMVALAVSVWLMVHERKIWTSKKSTAIIKRTALTLTASYILSYSILRLCIPYLDFNFYDWAGATWWRLLFFPINYLETILFFFLPSNISSSIERAHYFQIFIIAFIFSVGLGYQLIKRRFSYLASSGIIYALGLFLVAGSFDPGYRDNLNLSIHVPHIFISKTIEKNQYGPFYKTVQYLENKYQNGPGYEIAIIRNRFGIKQFGQADLRDNAIFYPNVNSGPIFSLDTNNMRLEEVQAGEFNYDFMDLETMEQEIIDGAVNNSQIYFTPLDEWSWPAELKCGDSDEVKFSVFCGSLIYKGETLMELNHDKLYVFDLELSEDKNHLMVVIEVDSNDQAVYLLDLSEI